MADIYVDTNAIAGGDGSEITPFDSLADVTWADNLTVKIKRGSNENLTATEVIGVDRSQVTVESYGSNDDPLPIISLYKNDLSSGWVEITTNVWVYTFSDLIFNPPLLIGIDTLTNGGIRKQFTEPPQSQTGIAVITIGVTTQIQAFGHGLVDGQHVYITEVTGGSGVDINGYHQITLVNVNIFTINVNTVGQAAYLNGRTLAMLDANIPAANGQWDYWQGVASHNAALFIYAESDPASYYSNIYYARWFETPFTFYRSTGTIEFSNLEFIYFGRPWTVGLGSGSTSTAGRIWIHNCVFHEGYIGVELITAFNATQFWMDGAVVEHNHIYNCRASGIAGADYVKNSRINNNLIHDCCQYYSDGGIYFGNCYAPAGEENHIYSNEVYSITAGIYWPVDGVGIMMDSDCSNVLIYRNNVHDTEIALSDNSAKNIKWFGNKVVDCDFGIIVSDSELVTGMDISVHGNLFKKCGSDNYSGSAIINKDRALRVNCASGDTTAVINIVNNIIYGSSDITSIGLSFEQQWVLAGATYTESNNCFFNNERELQENGVDVSGTIDATDIVSDPLLDINDIPLKTSPCFASGKKWWVDANPQGFNGEPFSDFDTDIGANQSTFGPFHPKNL